MNGPVLVPPAADAQVPVRMRQPTKDAYRRCLAQGHDLVEQLRAEVGDLRARQRLPPLPLGITRRYAAATTPSNFGARFATCAPP